MAKQRMNCDGEAEDDRDGQNRARGKANYFANGHWHERP